MPKSALIGFLSFFFFCLCANGKNGWGYSSFFFVQMVKKAEDTSDFFFYNEDTSVKNTKFLLKNISFDVINILKVIFFGSNILKVIYF